MDGSPSAIGSALPAFEDPYRRHWLNVRRGHIETIRLTRLIQRAAPPEARCFHEQIIGGLLGVIRDIEGWTGAGAWDER